MVRRRRCRECGADVERGRAWPVERRQKLCVPCEAEIDRNGFDLREHVVPGPVVRITTPLSVERDGYFACHRKVEIDDPTDGDESWGAFCSAYLLTRG